MKKNLSAIASSSKKFLSLAVVFMGVSMSSFVTRSAKSDDTYVGRGTAAIYGPIAGDQIEFLSSPERIKSVVTSNSPQAIWEALEHGERVECFDCIGAVSPLLYDANEDVREISAWWLRRRMFGVFGKGEVYEKTLGALKSDPNPKRRAYAAAALGEFLVTPGIAACAEAVRTDKEPEVRAAAALALGRLNDDGNGALGAALFDANEEVKLAALRSVVRINKFEDPGFSKLVFDASARVRKSMIEAIETKGVKESSVTSGLETLAKTDKDADVRIAACHALGALGVASARATLEQVLSSDPDTFVRDQAKIALRRI